MECVIDFLHDNYQENLRNFCQLQSEKYEEALERYKYAFISEIKLIKNDKGLCAVHKGHDYGELILSLFNQIKLEEVEEFFDKIVESYISWINTKGECALKLLEEILEKYGVLEFSVDISEYIFFRGRRSDNILTPWDMFHIPFNKRYLISNQRYSLTGQPLVYLGLSIYDVLSELDMDFNNFNSIKISTYKFQDEFIVYDLRNEFYKYFGYNPLNDIVVDGNEKSTIIIEDFKKQFYKFILSSICSFEKRKEHNGFSFCEEYVIPQLLAQIVKKRGLKGIIYSSTRIKSKENDEKYNTKYKDNVAIFTNFCKEHIYDKLLFEKTLISNPISFEKIKNITLENIKYICDKIKILDKDKKYKNYYLVGMLLEKDFSQITVTKETYFENNIGKMHMYMVFNLLMDIRNKCMIEG